MGGEQVVQRAGADLRRDGLGVRGERVRQRLRRRAVRMAVVLLGGDDEPGPLEGPGQLVEWGEPDGVGVGHRRPLSGRERRSLLEDAAIDAAADVLDEVSGFYVGRELKIPRG